METQKVIDLSELKPIESEGGVDLEQYDKKEVLIDKAEVIQVNSEYTTCKKQWVLKVSSEVLETLGEGDDLIEFRASELFNLMQDEEGKLLGYPNSDKSNLARFMSDIKATNPNEIKHKKALVKAYQKQDKTYLKFRY